jgi:hypothetical protein
MMRPRVIQRGYSGMLRPGDASDGLNVSRHRATAIRCTQPPMEKCAEKARANEPKPPRVTPPDPESGAPPDDAWLVPLSLLKKLERDQ